MTKTELPERLQPVFDQLTAEWQTASEIAGELELAASTVGRYLRTLRDEFGVEIQSSRRHGYRLPTDEPDDDSPDDGSETLPALDERQRQLIQLLPATVDEIAASPIPE